METSEQLSNTPSEYKKEYKEGYEDRLKKQKILEIFKANYKDAEIVKNANDAKIDGWRSVIDSKKYGTEVKGKSAYVSDMTRNLLNWQIPALVEPLVNNFDLINCEPFTAMDYDIAEQEQALLTHFFMQRDDHFTFITDLVTIISEQGTCFVKTGWLYKEEEVEVEVPDFILNPITGESVQIGSHTEMVTQVVENRPTKEICNTKDIRMDPTCKGVIAKASFVIHDFESTISELKSDIRYNNIDAVISNLNTSDDLTSNLSIDSTFSTEDIPRKKVIVHEYWGKFDINDTGIATPVVCAWVDNVIIRFDENPLPDQEIPFEKAIYSKKLDSIYGEALPEITRKKQHIDSVLNRGIFDDLKAANNGQVGTKKGFTDSINLKKMRTNQPFEYNTSMNDVWVGQYRGISPSIFNVINSNSRLAESVSGIRAFSMENGGNALGNTAAAVNATVSSGAKREMHIVRGIAQDCLIPILRKYSKYMREFLTPQEVEEITDKPFVPSSHKSAYDIKMSLESIESRNTKAQQTGFVLQTLAPTLPPEAQMLLLSRYMKLINEPDIAKIIKDFKPQPDPADQRIKDLEIQLLEAKVNNERNKAEENATDVILKQAKTREINSKTDLVDLDFIAKDQNTEYEQELAKLQLKYGKGGN